MIFFTILEVKFFFCCFRLVLEEKTGKDILESSRLEFFEKFLANNFALSDTEDNHSWSLNKESIADLQMLRTLLAIRQIPRTPSFWKVMDSFVLVAYTSLAASRTLFQRVLAWFLWTVAAGKAIKSHGKDCDLTWYLRRGICASISARTHSQNSLAAAEALR